MNDPEPVEVDHARHDLRELEAIDDWMCDHGETASGPTIRRRFASRLDLAYCITFPLGIHSERMRKGNGSADIEIPNKGKMFGWDRCFQPMTSRHNF